MDNLLLPETFHTALAIILVCYGCIVLASIVDTIDAIITVRAIGRPVESAKLRHALGKTCKYILYLTPFVMIDMVLVLMTWAGLPVVTAVVTLLIVGIELRSMAEHARCRKDKVAKVPSSLRDLIEFVGEDELRSTLIEMGKRKIIGLP